MGKIYVEKKNPKNPDTVERKKSCECLAKIDLIEINLFFSRSSFIRKKHVKINLKNSKESICVYLHINPD